MKKWKIQGLSIFFLMIGILIEASPSKAEEKVTPREILTNLFPKSKVKTYPKIFGFGPQEVVAPIRRKGWHGMVLLDFEYTKMKILRSDLGVLAFLIFLQKDLKVLNEMIGKDPEDGYPDNDYVKGQILLQVIFFNPKTKSFLAKPKNFPMKNDLWFGSVTNTKRVVISFDLFDINESNNSILLEYSYPLEDNIHFFRTYHKVLAFSSKRALTSKRLMSWYRGESGYSKANYYNFTLDAGRVTADHKIICPSRITGSNSREIPLQELEEDEKDCRKVPQGKKMLLEKTEIFLF